MMITKEELEKFNKALDELLRLPRPIGISPDEIRPDVKKLADVVGEFFDLHEGDPQCEKLRMIMIEGLLKALKQKTMQ